MKKQQLIKIIILSILTLIAYIPSFIWMIDRWTVADTYYSHGFLVPLISAFLAWQKREKLAKLKISPSNSGWLLLGPSVLIYVISALLRINFSAALSLIPVLIGIVLLFLGKEFLKELLFPLLFLIFMIPLPSVAIVNLSFKLKIFAAQISTFIINKLGVPAIREGSVIKTMHSYLMVEDPCSGIRSLIALISLGALMAYFSNISKTKQAILFLSSIPIAIGTNVIRIVALSLASEMYGAKFATGWFHNTMGVLIFVFAFVGLALVAKLLE